MEYLSLPSWALGARRRRWYRGEYSFSFYMDALSPFACPSYLPFDLQENGKKTGMPKVDIPLETFFFTTLLGPNLLVNSTPGSAPALVDTANALHNTRLVALYFSAHWCGPCRQVRRRCVREGERMREVTLQIVF